MQQDLSGQATAMHFRNVVKRAIQTLTLFSIFINVAGCATNPYTHRSQFLLVPES